MRKLQKNKEGADLVRLKKGYRKILAYAAQARRDGLDYF